MATLSPSDRVALIASNGKALCGLMWIWFLANKDFYLSHLIEHEQRKTDVSPKDNWLLKELAASPHQQFKCDGLERMRRLSSFYHVGSREKELEAMKYEIAVHLLGSASSVRDLIPLLFPAIIFCPDTVEGGALALEQEESVRNIWRRHMGALEKYIRCVINQAHQLYRHLGIQHFTFCTYYLGQRIPTPRPRSACPTLSVLRIWRITLWTYI